MNKPNRDILLIALKQFAYFFTFQPLPGSGATRPSLGRNSSINSALNAERSPFGNYIYYRHKLK
jgi:hypothetical protein